MTQDTAFAILTSGASVFLTGEPGAGKTHTVNRYVRWLRDRGIEPALTASTGIAATHIGGMTIHSWSGIGILQYLGPRDIDRIASTEKTYERITKAKVLILDEVSMMDGRMLSGVDAVCRAVRRSMAPFGGLQVVLVGDFFQLPPVSRDGTGQYAFRSPAWEALAPTVCYLTEQHRQDDPEYLDVLSAIRRGCVADAHHQALRGRMGSREAAPADAVKLYAHNADVDRLNAEALARIPGAAKSYEMRTVGRKNLVEALQRGCLSPENLELKVGAAVMFTRNDPQRRFVNGTIGTVERFDQESGLPVVRTRSGTRVTAEPMTWSMEDQGKPVASIEQVPLRLAWAMTIHKSQGMGMDAAFIDLGSAFEYGQGYVALSRVRRLSGLHLLGCNEIATQVHPEILAQDATFRADSDAAEDAVGRLTGEEIDARAAAFVAASGGRPASSDAGAQASGEGTPSRGSGERPKIYDLQEMRETHPQAYAKWTPEEVARVVAAFKAGESTAKIAAATGRKRGAISSRLKKLGLME